MIVYLNILLIYSQVSKKSVEQQNKNVVIDSKVPNMCSVLYGSLFSTPLESSQGWSTREKGCWGKEIEKRQTPA